MHFVLYDTDIVLHYVIYMYIMVCIDSKTSETMTSYEWIPCSMMKQNLETTIKAQLLYKWSSWHMLKQGLTTTHQWAMIRPIDAVALFLR